jgi:virulence-associated protein VapD
LVIKRERKKSVRSYRHRWEDIKCILEKYGTNAWTGFIWLRMGALVDMVITEYSLLGYKAV